MVPSNIGAETGLKAINSLVLVVIDWVKREFTKDPDNGIRRKLRNKLGDLHNVYDLCLYRLHSSTCVGENNQTPHNKLKI